MSEPRVDKSLDELLVELRDAIFADPQPSEFELMIRQCAEETVAHIKQRYMLQNWIQDGPKLVNDMTKFLMGRIVGERQPSPAVERPAPAKETK